jgi:hypothetical protein
VLPSQPSGASHPHASCPLPLSLSPPHAHPLPLPLSLHQPHPLHSLSLHRRHTSLSTRGASAAHGSPGRISLSTREVTAVRGSGGLPPSRAGTPLPLHSRGDGSARIPGRISLSTRGATAARESGYGAAASLPRRHVSCDLLPLPLSTTARSAWRAVQLSIRRGGPPSGLDPVTVDSGLHPA